MPNVTVRDHEPFEVALRRFKRSCEKAGIQSEVRRREYYEKPAQERKRRKASAVKRHLKNLSRDSAILSGSKAQKGEKGGKSKGGRGGRGGSRS